MDSKTIEMAALGRALFPGMLYDCRSDSFIPGVTLWDAKAIKNNIDTRERPSSDFMISTSDSFKEKSNLLDVSASLKASFLGGLIEVGGSAKYLKNDVSLSQRRPEWVASDQKRNTQSDGGDDELSAMVALSV
ncbi:UNVERIFIED_CONTAM: hypothetical protein FKN15_054568 [Acipenser sinensis]